MTINPLTHDLEVMRSLYQYGEQPIPMNSVMVAVAVTGLAFGVAVALVARRK
jgi:ABC-type polysaccharide/polyol phosphate export permease